MFVPLVVEVHRTLEPVSRDTFLAQDHLVDDSSVPDVVVLPGIVVPIKDDPVLL